MRIAMPIVLLSEAMDFLWEEQGGLLVMLQKCSDRHLPYGM